MTRKHMEILCMVCRERSMTRAAEKLHMTQPAVSRAVAELEEGYGVRIFDRVGRGLRLTPPGERLWEDAEAILSDFARLERDVSEDAQPAELTVGCSLGIGYSRMRGFVEAFRASHPDVKVFVRENYTASIQEMLLSGEMDFAVVEGRIRRRGIVTEPVFTDEILILAPPDHPLALREKVTAADLVGERLLLPDAATDTRVLIDHLFDVFGLSPAPVWTGLNLRLLVRMAADGEGITMVSGQWAEEELRTGRLLALPSDLPLRRTCCIARLEHRYLSEAAKDLMAVCAGKGQERSAGV